MTTVRLTFPMPYRVEGTCAPYWLIIDPEQMMKPSADRVADMVTGPFFSREEAQQYLEARRHAFSFRACVYCHSGYASHRYKQAWEIACREKEAALKRAEAERCECPGACACDDESACAACVARGSV